MTAQEDFRDLDNPRLKQELEAAVMDANRALLPRVLGPVTKADMKDAIELVARLRAEYLAGVVSLARAADAGADPAAIDTLAGRRRAYEEALAGVAALRHALARGYVGLDGAEA